MANCLHNLTQPIYPRDRFKVIVVNDGMRAPLIRALKQFALLAPWASCSRG